MAWRRRAVPRNWWFITRSACIASLLLTGSAASLLAEECATPAPVALSPTAWASPLDRLVTVGTDRTLREALDRIARESRVRLSYSDDLLPLDRTPCAASERQLTLGDALVSLLGGTGLAPVIASSDHVVLAPSRSAVSADATHTAASAPKTLDRIVVTGTALGGLERSSPFALSVLEGTSMTLEHTRDLAAAFNGAVAGLWAWPQSPATSLSRYASLRGASSFGISAPKMYVDGIEVANPLLLTSIDASAIQSIEVIRGPQGAALYGADAISGVVNIRTRHDGSRASTPAFEIRSSAGGSASVFVPPEGHVIVQEHGGEVRGGTAVRSASANLNVSSFGSFLPDATNREVIANAGGRVIESNKVMTATAMFTARDIDSPVSPLLARPADAPPSPPREQRALHYTAGGSFTMTASDRLTHALIAGMDGYSLAGMLDDGLPAISAADSALRAARGYANRLTLRASTTWRASALDLNPLSVTLGAEHSTAAENTNGAGSLAVRRPRDGSRPRPRPGDESVTSYWNNTGAFAHAQLAARNFAFGDVGLRVEHLNNPSTGSSVVALPMIGGALVRGVGAVEAKVRGAYGRGIRPARTLMRGATTSATRPGFLAAQLDPEQQEGTEAGMDLVFGRRAMLRVTRFDQRATGLVQPIIMVDTIARDTAGAPPPGPGPGDRQLQLLLQNVGEITNRGWEVEQTVELGRLAIGATFSSVDSRVRKLAERYRGDLRVGDRMLEVPARTMGVNAAWRASRWSASTQLSRAFDWINYDRVGLSRALADSVSASGPVQPAALGPMLRSYWITYAGNVHVGATFSVDLGRGLAATASGDNLLNEQVGEPDNATILPGRTFLFGVRARW